MQSVTAKIIEIEKRSVLSAFTYKGENVWPIIRMAIYLADTKAKGEAGKFLFFKSSIFLLWGALDFLRNLFVKLFKRRSYHSVLMTSSHYKVFENGEVHDRVISPVLDYLTERGKAFSVWEFTGKFHYDRSISYKSFLRPIQREVYFLFFIQRVIRPFKKKQSLDGDVANLNSLLNAYNVKFRIDSQFVKKLENIFYQADVFKRELLFYKVKNVFVVCYYDVKCFSLVLAANRLGLLSVDLQHGIQGKNHFAYAQWPNDIPHTFLPTHFFVWDKNSYDTIAKWKSDRENILLGCNKWFMDRAVKVSNDIILVSLQPIENYLPDYLVEIIQNYIGKEIWYIRLHPRQLGEVDAVEKRLLSMGLMGKVNIREASALPLTSLLQRTVVHVTFYSSVVIEASYYNIPTYFLDEKSKAHYVNYFPEDQIFYYPNHTVDVVVKRALEQNDFNSDVSKKIDVLDRFINGFK